LENIIRTGLGLCRQGKYFVIFRMPEIKNYFFVMEVDSVQRIDEPVTANLFPFLAFRLFRRDCRKQFQLRIGVYNIHILG
jgi:hypothetical protein